MSVLFFYPGERDDEIAKKPGQNFPEIERPVQIQFKYLNVQNAYYIHTYMFENF